MFGHFSGPWPASRVSCGVNDGQDLNPVMFDGVKNAEGKSRKKRAAYARNNLWVQKRDLLKSFEL